MAADPWSVARCAARSMRRRLSCAWRSRAVRSGVPEPRGETYGVTYNPAHRWFYVPEMQPDEALLLKCFDSATDGRARFAPHTAFEDPTAPADVLPRESIEIRTLVFHEA